MRQVEFSENQRIVPLIILKCIMVPLFFLNWSFWNWDGFIFLGTTLECCTLILTFTMAMEYRKRSTSLIESWLCPSTNTETTFSPAQVTVFEITFYLEVFNNFLLSMKESKLWILIILIVGNGGRGRQL